MSSRKNHFRYRCFSPMWPMRHMKLAYAYGYAAPADDRRESGNWRDEEDEGQGNRTWYAHRQHRGRRRHGAGSFGVRRPLRYLSYQLDLDESQRRQIAAALDSVKLEREQAELDEKKMLSELADLVDAGGGENGLDTDTLKSALSARVRSSEQLQKRTAKALKQIAEVLDPDQRQEFAYLIRTGEFRV
jgi:Spy/CpxP family protein refolding chaperone